MDCPRCSASPSIWKAEVAAPQRNPGGSATRSGRAGVRPDRHSSQGPFCAVAGSAPGTRHRTQARPRGVRRHSPGAHRQAYPAQRWVPLPDEARPAGHARADAPGGSTAAGSESAAAPPRDRPEDGRLLDRFGRVATDLRVSLTDRCNLRCTYCMPPEGLDWLPEDRGAHRRRDLPAGHGSAVEHLGIQRGPVHRRRAAAARRGLVGSSSTPRHGAAAASRRSALTTNGDRAGAASPPRSPPPAWTGSTCRLDTLDRGPVQAAHPPRPAGRRPRRAGRGPGRRADAGQGQHGADARGQRRRGRAAAALLPRARLPAAVHRADAAGRPRTPGTGGEMVTAEEILARLPRGVRAHPDADPRTGPAPAETLAGRRAARRTTSASSPRSPGRSAAPATGPGSPPTARSATACSPARSPTCGRRCAVRGGRRRAGRRAGGARCGQEGRPRHRRPAFLRPARPMCAIGG